MSQSHHHHHHHHRSRRKKQKMKNRVLIILGVVLLVIAIPLTAGIITFNHYLSKVNYEEETKEINPELTENISDPEADKDISENIDDPRMWYNDNIINILLIGRDLGHGSKYYPRADSVIIVSINKLKNDIKLVSLSRATYVSIPGHGNARLNAAHAYGGAKLLIDTIEQNYKIRIDHYVSIDFNGFIKAVDALGGVDIALTEAEIKALAPILRQNGTVINGAGTYHLNGNEALEYARLRDIDSDRARTERQRTILLSIFTKFKKMYSTESYSTLLSKGTKFLDQVLPLVSTDFTKSEIIGQATTYAGYLKWPFTEAIIPRNKTPLTKINGIEVLIVNWANIKHDIHEVLYPGIEPQEQS